MVRLISTIRSELISSTLALRCRNVEFLTFSSFTLGYNPTEDTVAKYWTSSPMTYQQFSNIISNEKLPSEHDLIEQFR